MHDVIGTIGLLNCANHNTSLNVMVISRCWYVPLFVISTSVCVCVCLSVCLCTYTCHCLHFQQVEVLQQFKADQERVKRQKAACTIQKHWCVDLCLCVWYMCSTLCLSVHVRMCVWYLLCDVVVCSLVAYAPISGVSPFVFTCGFDVCACILLVVN